MTTIPMALVLAQTDNTYATMNRMASVHHELPQLLMLLGGSAVSEELFDILDTRVDEGGILEGQSRRIPEEEDELPEPTNEYIRPNGEVYYARDWSGRQDVLALREASTAGLFPLFYGPPGTGKTALAEAAFGEPLITYVCTGDTTVTDLVGGYVPNPKSGVKDEPEYVWVDGPLLIAVREGRPFLADEIGLLDPKVGSTFYALMDGRNTLFVEANAQIGAVKAAPGFFVIAATNPNAPGVSISEALLSRFTLQVEVTTDWALAVSVLGVPQNIAGIASSLNKQMSASTVGWAPQMRELLGFRDASRVFGQEFALNNLIALAPEPDREVVQEAVQRFYADALAARI